MLLGNYSVLNKNPGRAFAGSTVSDTRPQFGKSGPARGSYVCTQGFSAKSGIPNGYRPPGSWQIAIKAGALSSTNFLLGSGTLTGSGELGVNGAATLAGVGSLTGLGQLVVSAVATLTGSGDISNANLLAVLNAVASLAGSGDLAGAMNAIGHATATLPGTGALTLTSYATGEMAAAITPFTELSPEALSAAVWTSAEGALLYALAHNRVVTDPAAGTFTVYAEDDVTVLFTADLWADASGTTPYSGSGAERRDRLA